MIFKKNPLAKLEVCDTDYELSDFSLLDNISPLTPPHRIKKFSNPSRTKHIHVKKSEALIKLLLCQMYNFIVMGLLTETFNKFMLTSRLKSPSLTGLSHTRL